MCWSSSSLALVAFAVLLQPGVAIAESDGFVVGFGGAVDTARGRAATVFGDVSIAGNTWLSAMIANTRTGGPYRGLDTLYADAGIDHWFEPLGIRVGGGYWGDDRILDSNDLRAAVYIRNSAMSISADYERRNFDLTIANDLLPQPRIFEFYGDGYGVQTRFEVSDVMSMSLGGMTYRYSRNINLQPNVDVLRILSTSRLGLMNSLLDYRMSAGVDWRFGLHTVDIRIESWQTAIDQGRVDSIGAGILAPMGDYSDMEFRLAYDHSENFGGTLALSVFYYFFGA